MTERSDAIMIANKVLDRINADPDDDIAVLARQLLCTREALDELQEFARAHPGTFEHWKLGRAK